MRRKFKLQSPVVIIIVSTVAVTTYLLNEMYHRIPSGPVIQNPSGSVDKPSSTDNTTASLPAEIINLTNWKLTLPINTEAPGSPDEIKQPQLANYTNQDFFHINDSASGVVLRANAGGYTTRGSNYPRTELREMDNDGTTEASWSNASGVHKLSITQAVTALPPKKPHVVTAQIHDAKDDIVMIRLENKSLFVQADGKNVGELDDNYVLGTIYGIDIIATSEGIDILYNGQLKATYDKVGSGYYFKAGCYIQSNISRGDSADAFGEVVIYDLSVSHR